MCQNWTRLLAWFTARSVSRLSLKIFNCNELYGRVFFLAHASFCLLFGMWGNPSKGLFHFLLRVSVQNCLSFYCTLCIKCKWPPSDFSRERGQGFLLVWTGVWEANLKLSSCCSGKWEAALSIYLTGLWLPPPPFFSSSVCMRACLR